MAFNMFKKKNEVVDFRKRDSDMPIPARLKERLLGNSASSQTPLAGSPITGSNSPTSSGSSGGFFSFFGGNSDSSSNTSTNTQETSSQAQTDFWGNPVTNSSSTTSNASSGENHLGELSSRLSRMTDRIELVEKKLDRLERKTGVSGEY